MRGNLIARAVVSAGALLALTASVSTGDEPKEENRVTLVVMLKGDAELLVQDQPTKTTGESRRLMSPPLTPGKTYTYSFKATWTENGKDVSREATVKVQAGQTVIVDLTPVAGDPIKTPDEPKVEKKALPPEPKVEKKTPPDEPKVEKKTPPPEPKVEKKAPPDEPKVEKKTPPPEPKVEKKAPPDEPKVEKKTPPDEPKVEKKTPPPEPKVEKKTPPDEPKVEKKTPPPDPKVEKKIDPKLPEKLPIPDPKVQKKTPPPEPKEAAVKLAMPGTLTLQMGGFTKLLPVKIVREGFEGPITIKFEKLPDGVTLKEVTIPADKSEGDVEASVSSDAEAGEIEVKVLAEADKAKGEFTLKVKVVKK